ncbi:MAG: Zn-ribbon domain-containing OB-fold protein [Pyrodictiaceae archaeon]
MRYVSLSPPRTWRTRIPRYRLIGAECLKCGKRHFPPKPVCPYCGSRELKYVELPRTGVVETYSVIYNVPEGYRLASPIISAVVRLDDGTLVTSVLTDVEPDSLSSGLRVEAVFRKIREDGEHGLIEYGLKFRPIRVNKG